MSMPGWSLASAPVEEVNADLLRAFLDEQREANLISESRILELKLKPSGDNVARAIAGLANTDGGIVLVGLPDNDPEFDAGPGVPIATAATVSNQCRSLLDPQPDFDLIPVAIPERDTIVLVIRVYPLTVGGPVVKNGNVFIRAPGETVGATRDQIAALVHRSETAGAERPSPLAVFNLFNTEAITTDDEFCDFRVRVAGSVVLRTVAPEQLLLGSQQRAALVEAFQESALTRYPREVDRAYRYQSSKPRPTWIERTSRRFSLATTYTDSGESRDYRVSLTVVRDGFSVAFAVDLAARLGPARDIQEVRIGREELATTSICALEAISLLLPGALIRATSGSVVAQSPATVWIDCARAISEAIDTKRLPGEEHRQLIGPRWGFQVPNPRDVDEAGALIGLELQRMYLDLGLEDEAETARRDVTDALAQRQRTLNEPWR